MDDQRALVEKIVSGDKNAFREVIEKHQRLVSHIVFRMVSAKDDREDICQEVFIKVYQNLKSFRFDCRLSTWIGRIACNNCLNFLDKKSFSLLDDLDNGSTLVETQADTARTDNAVEQKQLSELLRRKIEYLPAIYRTVVTLYHLDQMNYAEIAAVTSLPEGTIKSHLFRGRQILKNQLLAEYKREEL